MNKKNKKPPIHFRTNLIVSRAKFLEDQDGHYNSKYPLKPQSQGQELKIEVCFLNVFRNYPPFFLSKSYKD